MILRILIKNRHELSGEQPKCAIRKAIIWQINELNMIFPPPQILANISNKEITKKVINYHNDIFINKRYEFDLMNKNILTNKN